MDAELAAKSKSGNHNFLAGLKDKRTLAYSALYFGLVCGIYGLGLWMPTIVAALGKFSTAEVGFIVFIPYAVAAVFVYFWSKRADRTGKRAWHAAVSMVLAGVGLLAAGYLLPVNPVLAMIGLTALGHGDLRRDRPLPLDALRRPDRRGCRFRAGPGELARKPRRLRLPVRRRPPQGRHGQQPERPPVPRPSACAITAVATYLYARKRPEGDAALDPRGRSGCRRRPRQSPLIRTPTKESPS